MLDRKTIFVAALAGACLLLSAGASLAGLGASRSSAALRDQVEALAAEGAPAKLQPAKAGALDVRRDPTDLPGPVGWRTPETVVAHLEAMEVEGQLADGATAAYWTFNGTVPGPMIRARVGDAVEVHLKNNAGSGSVHSIDLHAVTGPGGGAVSTQVAPGEEKSFRFTAMHPGVYVYHCASPFMPAHIAMGMYGLIVIEPEEGLPSVDHEFYVMQGEFYTNARPGTAGHHEYDGDALLAEEPSFVLFNGAYQALADDLAMRVKTGESIRLFMGNAGPNLASSVHVVGEIFDTVHREGGSEADHHVQTTLIPSGGASWMEFAVDVPGTYTLLDHSISRAISKGAMALIIAEGAENPAIYDGRVESGGGH